MKRLALLSGISSLILLLFLTATDPRQLHPVLLMVPFVLVMLIIFSTIILVFNLSGQELENRKKLKIAAMIAAMPALLLILKSLGQLTARDVIAILALFAVGYFYMSRLNVRAVER